MDTTRRTYRYNHEYYLMKHFSHFVLPGAKRLETGGMFNDLVAFRNPDQRLVVVVRNDSRREKSITIAVGEKTMVLTLPADSFNTIVLPAH